MGKAMRWLFRFTGFAMLLNGVWMLLQAVGWFFNIPAGLPDTGPPNGHLIRDVGLAYVVFGAATLWVCQAPAPRRAVFVCAAAFSAGHALCHLGELLLGTLPASHWLLDAPLVLGPGLLYAAACHPRVWRMWACPDADALLP